MENKPFTPDNFRQTMGNLAWRANEPFRGRPVEAPKAAPKVEAPKNPKSK